MNTAHASQLTQLLEQEILTGALAPGQRLEEQALGRRFGVSRTPVREALLRLAATGLVEIRPRRGALVRAVSLPELIDMFETMAEQEASCVRFAARRMSDLERQSLQTIHRGARAAVAALDFDTYYLANEQFHEAIYAGSHNRFLEQQTIALRNRLAPYRRLQLRRAGRLAESFAEHDGIAAAIEARDVDLAGQLLHQHVARQSGTFNDFLAALPPHLLTREAS